MKDVLTPPYPVWPGMAFSDFLRKHEQAWHTCPGCEAPLHQEDEVRVLCASCNAEDEQEAA